MRRRKRSGRWLRRLRCALVRTAAKSTPPYTANWARSSDGSKHKPLERLGNAKLPQLSLLADGGHLTAVALAIFDVLQFLKGKVATEGGALGAQLTRRHNIDFTSQDRCIPVCIPDLRRRFRTHWRASEDCARAASIDGVRVCQSRSNVETTRALAQLAQNRQ